MIPKININIIVWNSIQFLPELLSSIEKQTYQNKSVLIIDNGSTDGTESFVKEKYPQVAFLRNVRNLGFSVANNQGIRFVLEHGNEPMEEKAILIVGPDMILTETCLETLVKSMEGKEEYGSFGGKLLRAYREGFVDEPLKEIVRSDRIDSTGIRLRKNFSFLNRGAGEMDEGQYDKSGEVFGHFGSLVLLRAVALMDLREGDEFFDTDFFSYKEDIDLAWRLQQMGWKSWYEPNAKAYHYFGKYWKERFGWIDRMKNHREKSRMFGFFSIRNHWLLLVKNLDVVSLIISFPRLFLREMFRLMFLVLFETKNSNAFVSAIRLTPKMLQKRFLLKKKKTVSGRWIRKRFLRV